MSESAAAAATGAASDARPRIGLVGMAIFLATDAMTFGGLLFAHVYLRRYGGWPEPGRVEGLPLALGMTALLALSAALLALAKRPGARGALLGSALASLLFVAGQAFEWTRLVRAGFTLPAGSFPASFFVLTGFHGLHVLAGALWLLALAARRKAPLDVAALYGFFVDAVWGAILLAVYVA